MNKFMFITWLSLDSLVLAHHRYPPPINVAPAHGTCRKGEKNRGLEMAICVCTWFKKFQDNQFINNLESIHITNVEKNYSVQM